MDVHMPFHTFRETFKLEGVARAPTTEEQVRRLRSAYTRTFKNLGISIPSATEFTKLERSAPEWPGHPNHVRSLSVRFGTGEAGVHQTSKAHFTHLSSVCKSKRLGQYSMCDTDRLQLFTGNSSHIAGVKWILIDLNPAPPETSIEEMRTTQSLADELLVFTWLHPEYFLEMLKGHGADTKLFATGYVYSDERLASNIEVPCLSVERAERDNWGTILKEETELVIRPYRLQVAASSYGMTPWSMIHHGHFPAGAPMRIE